jgi:hypothetical protein
MFVLTGQSLKRTALDAGGRKRNERDVGRNGGQRLASAARHFCASAVHCLRLPVMPVELIDSAN